MWQNFIGQVQSNLSGVDRALSFAPAWAAATIILCGAVVVALIGHRLALGILRRVFKGRHPYLGSVLEATKNPTLVVLVLIALAIAIPIAPLGPSMEAALFQAVALVSVFTVGWIAVRVLNLGAKIYLLRFRIDVADNLLARKHLTQVRVLTRVLDAVIVLFTLGFALMSIPTVRQYGYSLFASAGVAGIVAGLAARPVLSNLLAGIQLAVAQPIRLEDAVTVENEYGWIEEITSTYVVIRLWDLRRLIVPLSYFIEKPFYNWTRQAAANLGYVLLYLDYTAPIDVIRQKATEYVAQASEPGKVINVQVTNANAQAIELRVLLLAHNPANTSNLCAELREKLIGFMQREYPQALPRQRNEIVEPPTRKDGQRP